MSIMDANENEIIRMGTVNSWAFKIAIWAAPLCTLWLITKVLAHDTDIAVLKMQMSMRGSGSSMTNSVNVGSANEAEPLEASARTWLTTREVAEREGCDERTILNYIAAGQIEPAPVKAGKSWQISASFRIVPKNAESGRAVANAKLKPEEENKP